MIVHATSSNVLAPGMTSSARAWDIQGWPARPQACRQPQARPAPSTEGCPFAEQRPGDHDEHAGGHDGVNACHEDVKTDVVAGEERTGLRTPEPRGTDRGEYCVFQGEDHRSEDDEPRSGLQRTGRWRRSRRRRPQATSPRQNASLPAWLRGRHSSPRIGLVRLDNRTHAGRPCGRDQIPIWAPRGPSGSSDLQGTATRHSDSTDSTVSRSAAVSIRWVVPPSVQTKTLAASRSVSIAGTPGASSTT